MTQSQTNLSLLVCYQSSQKIINVIIITKFIEGILIAKATADRLTVLVVVEASILNLNGDREVESFASVSSLGKVSQDLPAGIPSHIG